MEFYNEAQALVGGRMMGVAAKQTTRERLLERKHLLENALNDINDALSALDTNPELEKFIEVIAKVS